MNPSDIRQWHMGNGQQEFAAQVLSAMSESNGSSPSSKDRTVHGSGWWFDGEFAAAEALIAHDPEWGESVSVAIRLSNFRKPLPATILDSQRDVRGIGVRFLDGPWQGSEFAATTVPRFVANSRRGFMTLIDSLVLLKRKQRGRALKRFVTGRIEGGVSIRAIAQLARLPKSNLIETPHYGIHTLLWQNEHRFRYRLEPSLRNGTVDGASFHVMVDWLDPAWVNAESAMHAPKPGDLLKSQEVGQLTLRGMARSSVPDDGPDRLNPTLLPADITASSDAILALRGEVYEESFLQRRAR